MAGRKKVTEETITTEERMGREMQELDGAEMLSAGDAAAEGDGMDPVSYTHLRAHET